MDFRDFLPLASTLASGSTEAEWRSAVSRAYYAAFHVARQLLSDLGFTVPREERAHSFVYRRLSNCGDLLVNRAGLDLDDLRTQRNHADYNPRRLVSQKEANTTVRMSEGIIQTLDAARAEPLRTQITDAMKVYERDVLQDVTWHP